MRGLSENANAVKLAALTVVVYVAAATIGLRLVYYLAYVLGAVLIASWLWTRLNRRGLEVRREVTPTQAQVGQVIRETIELRNLSWLRKLWVEVRDQSTLPGHHVGAVVTLPGSKSKRWQVRTRCIHRGLYRLGPTVVVTGDPFGLFQASQVLEGRGEVLVFPPTVPLSQFGLPSGELPGGLRTERRAFHSTPNAVSIREYSPGDPVNRIHWAVSARNQKLMVKEFELDPTADLWLVLDLHEDVHVSALEEGGHGDAAWQAQNRRRILNRPAGLAGDGAPHDEPLSLDPSTEEYAVTIVASLASFFISQGRSVGLIAWGQHHVTIPADRGGRQLLKILRALAVLRAEGTTPLTGVLATEGRQFGKQDTVVVVTPSVDEQWVDALRIEMLRIASAATVIVEPSTFGGKDNALMLVSALTAINVPTYLVKRDDAINAALAQEYGGMAVRNLR
ncbi:MAG: hypothetical protein QOH93_444 [Chloroflexia bacterium]|jgi:uncharacterized protein (DUF58 family)|nr:hypothetical protein [Chloroflexia bacterium]